jgi:Thermophilic metalloprotease (M29)
MALKLSRRGLLLGVVGTPILPGGAPPSQSRRVAEDAEAQLPPVDTQKIATLVVASLQPKSGERSVIVYDPTYYPELARHIQEELQRAGVYPIVALTFEPRDVFRAVEATGLRKREEDVVSLLRPIFEKSDIFLWLPGRYLPSDMRWERLVNVASTRGIHFHWIQPLDGRSAAEVQLLSKMYERAILETDYAGLSRKQDQIINKVRGQAIRITSPEGMDLRMSVPSDAWFHKNDGDMSPTRGGQARCARDREMEFPSGALRFIPDVTSVTGKLRVRRVLTPSGLVEGASMEFTNGRALQVNAEKNETALRAELDRIGGDIDKVGEIVLGTNPLLVASLPSGELPYYGYGAGYVRISLGDNWESGGANRSPSGRPLWLFVDNAVLNVGGEVLKM